MDKNFEKGIELYLKLREEKKQKRRLILNSLVVGTAIGLTAFNLANLANLGSGEN